MKDDRAKFLEENISNLRKELENVKKQNMYNEAAQMLGNLYQAYKENGFTDEQAFELVQISLEKSLK